MYRPERWKKCTINKLTNYEGLTHAQCYEAGADAMLEALREKGWRIETIRDVKIPIPFPEKSKGWLVFIPEEE